MKLTKLQKQGLTEIYGRKIGDTLSLDSDTLKMILPYYLNKALDCHDIPTQTTLELILIKARDKIEWELSEVTDTEQRDKLQDRVTKIEEILKTL